MRVNPVAPTYIETPLAKLGIEEEPEMYRVWNKMTPMGRVGQPEEIALAALFLASDAASLLTGSVVIGGGGYAAQGRRRLPATLEEFDTIMAQTPSGPESFG